jgi:ABC-type amino acid transport substrate-binding protein
MVVEPHLVNEIMEIDDLNGCSVGVKIGSTGAKLADDLHDGGMDLTIKEYKDTFESLLDLEVGRVDVVFNDYLNTLVYLKDASSDLQIVQTAGGEVHFLSQAGLGIAVSAGEAELLAEINTSLAAMKQDGTLEQLHQSWLMAEREQE